MNLKDFIPSRFRKKRLSTIQFVGMRGTIGVPDSKADYISEYYEGSAAVYSVVKLLSETFAAAGHCLYKIKNQQKAQQYKVLSRNYHSSSLKMLQLKESAFEEIEQHPLLTLLNQPSPLVGGFDFRVHANSSRDILGDSFIWANRGLTMGDPIQLKILPAQYMLLDVKPGVPMVEIDGYRLQTGGIQAFSPDEVIHWKHPRLSFDTYGMHLYGQSPLMAAARDYTLSANKEGKKAAAKAFKHQGAGGLLSRNEDIPWKKEQRDDLNAYLDEVVNGNENRGKARAINAKFEWIQMSMSANDMKLLEALQMTKEDVCNIYNCPSHIFSGGRATQNNVGESNKYLVTKTVYPKWESWRDLVNNQLLPMFKDSKNLFYDFDISSFPEVQDDQAKYIDSLLKLPVKLNEIRRAAGWDEDPDPNMNKVYLDSNKVPLDKLNEPFGDNITSDVQDLNNEGVKDYDY